MFRWGSGLSARAGPCFCRTQDLKGSIRVFCRVRPLGTTGDSTAGCLDIGTDGELAAYDGKGERKVRCVAGTRALVRRRGGRT